MPTLVVEIGSALAVLIEDAAASPAARDAQAQAALRDVTERRDLMIARRPSGRPRLEPPYPELGVSMSHRGRWLLAAFSPEAAVGTDVEPDEGSLEAKDLAAVSYAGAEARMLAGLEPAAARDAFLRMWVAKEAALKVTGRGIYDGLDEPDLSGVLGALAAEAAAVELAAGSRLPALRLAVRRLDVGCGVYCGLAVEVDG